MCKFRPRTERTSEQNLKESKNGNKLSKAVSVGSENHDLIGIALSNKNKLEINNFSLKCIQIKNKQKKFTWIPFICTWRIV